MKPHTAALLVLNYNGSQHLQDCLSTALTAAAEIEGPCPVVLVDNRSTDASVAFTRKHFPAVEVVVSPRNDFLFSLNDVVLGRPEDIVIVLNNDMRFAQGFCAAVLAHFAGPPFSASSPGSATGRLDGHRRTARARIHHCWFYKWWSVDRQQTAFTLEACAWERSRTPVDVHRARKGSNIYTGPATTRTSICRIAAWGLRIGR